jgi:hypothetical protein
VGWISKERRKGPGPAGADERLRAHRISKSLIAGHSWLSKTRISDALRHAALKEQRRIYLTALLSSNGRGARTVVKRTEEQGASITAAYTEHSVAREESMRDCMTHGYYRFAQCSLIDTCVLLIPFPPRRFRPAGWATPLERCVPPRQLRGLSGGPILFSRINPPSHV